MTRSASHALAILVLAVVASAGCRSTPQPGDPMLDAIRAKERSGDLSYAESQGRNLFAQYCTTCHGDEGTATARAHVDYRAGHHVRPAVTRTRDAGRASGG